VNNQVIQYRSAGMLADVTRMQLLCLRLAQLTAMGELTARQASLAKLNSARLARKFVYSDAIYGSILLAPSMGIHFLKDISCVFLVCALDRSDNLLVRNVFP